MNEDSLDPTDGRYGWVVVICAFFSRGLTTAVLMNFDLFFLEIQNYYNVLTSTVSWVTSISMAKFHFGAPVTAGLGVYITQRGVMMIDGVLAVSCMIIASLNLGLPWMYLSLGVLQAGWWTGPVNSVLRFIWQASALYSQLFFDKLVVRKNIDLVKVVDAAADNDSVHTNGIDNFEE